MALDNAQKVFLLLLDLVARGGDVLDDLGRRLVAGRGRDVVKAGVGGEERGAGRSQKLRVNALQRHIRVFLEDCICACVDGAESSRGAAARIGISATRGVVSSNAPCCAQARLKPKTDTG